MYGMFHICNIPSLPKTVTVVVLLADAEPTPFSLAVHEYTPSSSGLMCSIFNADSVNFGVKVCSLRS